MGVRADITPQVARIDAHLLNPQGRDAALLRGSVLHTRPASPGATREPIQIGAEIFGERAWRPTSRSSACCARRSRWPARSGARLDIGHVAVFRAHRAARAR
jgi:ATP phosphoribosyltransferase regulatory subunit